MQLIQPRYVIAVPGLARSAAGYRDVLGFTIHGMGDPGLRWLQRVACGEFGIRTIDGHRMMFGEPPP